MSELFYLIRMPLLPIPLALWSIAWPLIAAGCLVLVVPVGGILITIWRTFAFPFVFLSAAFANEPERVSSFIHKWGRSYPTPADLLSSIEISKGYRNIFAWGRDPKSVPQVRWILTANFAVVVLFLSAVSPEFRNLAIGTVVVLGLIALWASS